MSENLDLFAERILAIMKEKDISYAELSRMTGFSSSALQRYFTRQTDKTPVELIDKLASVLGVSPMYLAGWENEDIFSIPGIMPIKKKKFPMLGEVACGEPIYADHKHDTYIEGNSDINADFCLCCKGDSMVGDGIQDGDVVFIRNQDAVNNGDIACVIIDDEATLKHIYVSENSITLVASNGQYPPLTYSDKDAKIIKILGKAVAFTRLL